MVKRYLFALGILFTAVGLSACSSSQNTTDRVFRPRAVQWFEAEPECRYTEIYEVTGRVETIAASREDRISGARAEMLEKARQRRADAVVKVFITETGGKGVEYKGRLIRFANSQYNG
jgi:hypothetical protein